LETLIPPIQRAPRSISGEFQISNIKCQNQISNLMGHFLTHHISKYYSIFKATPDWFIPTIQRIISSSIPTPIAPMLKFELGMEAALYNMRQLQQREIASQTS
jgi:hypothetical protein